MEFCLVFFLWVVMWWQGNCFFINISLWLVVSAANFAGSNLIWPFFIQSGRFVGWLVGCCCWMFDGVLLLGDPF